MEAILLQDKNKLDCALACCPGAANQVLLRGNTPLHLAVAWSQGLSLLLGKGGDIHHCNNSGEIPLFAALYESNYESARLLLEHNSPVGIIWHALDYWNVPLMELLITHLVDRRQRLLYLALGALPVSELAWLDLKTDRVLDAQAAAVVSALLLQSIDIPPALVPSNSSAIRTVYHNPRLNIQVAECLFSMGFLDIDEFDDNGLTPIWIAVLWPGPWRLDYPQWLIHKGADVHRVNPKYGVMALHALGAYIGDSIFHIESAHCMKGVTKDLTDDKAQIALSFLLYEFFR